MEQPPDDKIPSAACPPDMLRAELLRVVRRMAMEGHLTYSTAIGVLEIVKTELLMEMVQRTR